MKTKNWSCEYDQKGQINDLNSSFFNEVKYINQLFGTILECWDISLISLDFLYS
jgi:hypothetical protein